VIVLLAADFLKDLQAEFQNWEAGLNSNQKPKSLWEELAVSYLYSTFQLNSYYEFVLLLRIAMQQYSIDKASY
jgi:hypothetical protein